MIRIVSLTISLLIIIAGQLYGQCPPARGAGYHVVQKGETLYSISRKYNVSVQHLLQWNNMSLNDVLHLCRELRVSGSAVPGPQTAPAAGTGNAVPQTGALHIVKPGEKVADIARAYGWAEWRFRRMNNLTTWQEVSPGARLKTDDCVCPPLGYSEIPQVYETQQPAIVTNGVPTKPAEEIIIESKKQDTLAASGGTVAAGTSLPKMIAPFMMPAEITMAEEINLLRSNPAGYISRIEQRREEIRAGRAYGSVETCDELINELKNTLPLNLLDPLECLYHVAKNHGEEQRPSGTISHVGKDGSWPWDRVKKGCPTLSDGNENLIGGLADVRETVITLLLDEGISTRSHRRVLLSPDWRYAAVYYAGQVGSMPHNWIQVFGR